MTPDEYMHTFVNLPFDEREKVLSHLLSLLPDDTGTVMNTLGMMHLLRAKTDCPAYYESMKDSVCEMVRKQAMN